MRAIIFDMDGVIASTQAAISRLESLFFLRYGIHISPRKITRRFSGVSSKDMIPTVFAEYGKAVHDLDALCDERRRFIETLRDEDIVGIEGTIEMIPYWYACGVLLAVGSASRPEFIERVLRVLRVRKYFTATASSYEVEHGKPAPDVFLLAAERIDVEPRLCYVVEDGIAGMVAARRAEMKCVALVSDDTQDYPADIITRDLREQRDTLVFDLV